MRNPRPGCIETVPKPTGGLEYRITQHGCMHVLELASLGSSIPEIADFLQVSDVWLYGQIGEDSACPDVQAAFAEGKAEFKKRLRVAQVNLGDVNSQMAIWLGKQHLDQKDKQEIDITKKVHFIGTMPDYDQSPDDWRHKFMPSAAQRPRPIDLEAVEAEVEPAGNAGKFVSGEREK